MGESPNSDFSIKVGTSWCFNRNLLASDKGKVKSNDVQLIKSELESQLSKKRMSNFMKLFRGSLHSTLNHTPTKSRKDESSIASLKSFSVRREWKQLKKIHKPQKSGKQKRFNQRKSLFYELPINRVISGWKIIRYENYFNEKDLIQISDESLHVEFLGYQEENIFKRNLSSPVEYVTMKDISSINN